ncbi:coiled-coil domain-containing protein [Spirilliplanes yamanashiensis]|uniref:ARB-07466-like C-terminal domain-containing protein n=1 Tax=Spirilliplanes yamanashiensis TaxID=42233 RepID=A0A8J3YF94_9ACTN|nr:hypothetical protein [Spirilliplanes yamanashiensis]MDP9818372.1 hypothetical protein [Spirilliplanes yamanashiensis]GIJ06593.1 hypothetical protein Sya03_59450 [Spirilliplanes yamanashiensis]
MATIAAPVPGVAAEPNDAASTTDDEGAPKMLREVLDSTGRGYVKARTALDRSKKRQLTLSLELQKAEAKRDALLPGVQQMAAESYRTGKVTPFSVLLDSSTSGGFLERAQGLYEINRVNDARLRELNEAVAAAGKAQADVDREVAEEQRQLKIMTEQKRAAEKALALVGGKELTGGLVAATSPVARAAPRGPDGQFGDEGCNQDDPTTGGCVTARTLNALREAKKAGFNRFVGCHRTGGPFEHPKGRACDWSLRSRGFSAARNADEKIYGNNLAAFLVRNADRLGILYVIWYEKIWFPATGWKSYGGPKDHKDHVHMSML